MEEASPRHPQADPATEAGHRRSAGGQPEQHPRSLAWAVFGLKSNGRNFLFTNTHLTPSSIATRKAQWDEAIDLTNRLKGGMAVIAVGDYNTSKYDSYAATFLPRMKSAGYGDVVNQEYATNPVRRPRALTKTNAWINSFNGYRRNVAVYSYSTRRDKIGNGIDWVFASNSLVVKNWSVMVPMSSTRLSIAGIIPSTMRSSPPSRWAEPPPRRSRTR